MDEQMLALAREAMANAYAPYSGFSVGAVVRGGNGKLYAGCNVENAAYPESCCAEASAISAMVIDGERRIEEIAVIGRSEGLLTPCGGCRQKIREFGGAETRVHICGPDGLRRSFTLGELLPHAFGPDLLE